MEDYGNEVINSHAIYSRLLVNLLVKLTRMTPLGLGGGHGGYPPTSLLATVFAPPPLCGGHGNHVGLAQGPMAMNSLLRNSLGVGPKAQWPPAGGKYTLERLAGSKHYPTIP
jgi:hypothetical protein